ncbi:MFS transporter [Kutzneria viridogrisea]|nr:putative MFS family arabinose efflux permease [Kutzneria viridogrisea]
MRAYFLAATLARLGDEMVATAVVLFVLTRTGDPTLAGITLAAYAFPSVASGPLLGAWLDRSRHRRAALASNQVALGATMLGLLAVVGTAPGWLAPLVAAVAGVTVPLTSGGFTGLMTLLVAPDRLARANSTESISFSVAALGGPALASALALVLSPAAAVLGIAVSAALSLLALAAVPSVPARGAVGRLDVRAGLRHMVATPRLRAVTLTSTLSFGAVGMLLVALPVRTAELGAGGTASGFVLAAFEIGCMATNLALIRLQSHWQTVLVCTGLYGLALTGWALAGSLPVLLVLALVAGFTLGPELPALLGARQRYTPEHLLSQVGTTGASLKIGFSALGAAAGGLLLPVCGPSAVIGLVAAVQGAAVLLGWLASRGRVPVS